MKKSNRLEDAIKPEEMLSKSPETEKMPFAFEETGFTKETSVHVPQNGSPENIPQIKWTKSAKRTDGWDKSMLFL